MRAAGLFAALLAITGCEGWEATHLRDLAACSEARTCPPDQTCTPWGQCARPCTTCTGASCPECSTDAWTSAAWQCIDGFCQAGCTSPTECWASQSCDLDVGLCRVECSGSGQAGCPPDTACFDQTEGSPVCRSTGPSDGGVGDGGPRPCSDCPDGCCQAGVCRAPTSLTCGTGGISCSVCTGTTLTCAGPSCVAAPPSCSGLGSTCGPGGNASCCDTIPVPGGTYNRVNDPTYPATVSPFKLDAYEVTVGRFRVFVESGQGTQASPPAAGDGMHPGLPGSGWDSAWNVDLAADSSALKVALRCDAPFQTWTDAQGANEERPINCITWLEAFAFCAWDGGRMPTEAEWNFAAAGGDEQRLYPWSVPPDNAQIDNDSASWGCMGDGVDGCTRADFVKVGTKPAGNGRWGHADLAGNVWEFVLDVWGTYPMPCVDCANLVPTATARSIRGGADADQADKVTTTINWHWSQTQRSGGDGIGVRCARDQ